MGASPAISKRRSCANDRASVPAHTLRSRSRGSARPRTRRLIDRDAELERLSELFRKALAQKFGHLIDIRKEEVLAIVSGAAETAKQAARAFCEAAEPPERSVRVGISLDAREISALPQAYQEAERAVEFATETRPIMPFAEIDLMEFLVRRPDRAARRLIPDWAGRLLDADSGKQGELSRTISHFADCNFNVKRTARRLKLHTNTVYFRLNRIRELTGIDPRSYSGLSLLLTTLRMLDGHAPEALSSEVGTGSLSQKTRQNKNQRGLGTETAPERGTRHETTDDPERSEPQSSGRAGAAYLRNDDARANQGKLRAARGGARARARLSPIEPRG